MIAAHIKEDRRMPQVDPELFDRGQFQAELALKASPIAAFKKAIRRAHEVLDARFREGREVRRLVEDRAWFTDQILREAWDRLERSEDAYLTLVRDKGFEDVQSVLTVNE